MTHYRLESVDEVLDMFDPYDLAELEVAEDECPWGEMARNYRAEFLAATIRMMNAGSDEAFNNARNEAQSIRLKLFGRGPSPRPPKASDFAQG